MFAYKTTSGSAPLNSVLQTCVPSWSLCSASERRFIVPSKKHKTTSTDFYINCSLLVELPAQLNPSSRVLSQLQETSPPSLSDPLTLALSILILFNLSKKNTHTTLYQLHIYSLTASFSWKTNTSFRFSILSTCFLKKTQKTQGFFFLYSI